MQQHDFDPPEPPGVGPVKGFMPWRLIVGLVLGLALVAAAFWVPIPLFYAYEPGPVRDVAALLEIEGAPTYSSEGTLFMTTVRVDTSVTTSEMVATIFDRSRQLVSKDAVTGGRPLEEVRDEQAQQMLSSQESAEVVALVSLGLGTSGGDGVEIASTVSGSPAESVLRSGDVLTRVDGERVANRCDVGRAVAAQSVGDAVQLTISRAGRTEVVDIVTTANPRNPEIPFLGIVMQDLDYSFETEVEVGFEAGKVAGPSAGLMFSLGVYDHLSPQDLTGGLTIAGTGTLDCGGVVGSIGGIQQKVVAAEREGADVFFAPAANAPAAVEAASEIEVVAVATFEDALEYLLDAPD